MASSKDTASAMKVILNNAGKRFNYDWIFRGLNASWNSPNIIAVKGKNGAGKSTLMSLLGGLSSPNEGTIEWLMNNHKIDSEKIFQHISWCSPSIELPDEFTLTELIQFQSTFKNWLPSLTEKEILSLLNLEKEANQYLKNFSTGMKQRVKVAFAVLADVSMVLLDEPTSNLDEWGINWYKKLLQKYSNDRLIIIASNSEDDFLNTGATIILN